MALHHSIADLCHLTQQHWPESQSVVHEYLLLLHRLSQQELQQTQQLLLPHDLSLTEFDTLASLRRSPPPHTLTPTELQRSTLLSSGGQTKLLHKLERKGWIGRSASEEDKRSKLVHLTAAGRDRVEQAMEIVLQHKHQRLVSEQITAQQLQALCQQLQQLLSAVDEH